MLNNDDNEYDDEYDDDAPLHNSNNSNSFAFWLRSYSEGKQPCFSLFTCLRFQIQYTVQ